MVGREVVLLVLCLEKTTERPRLSWVVRLGIEVTCPLESLTASLASRKAGANPPGIRKPPARGPSVASLGERRGPRALVRVRSIVPSKFRVDPTVLINHAG